MILQRSLKHTNLLRPTTLFNFSTKSLESQMVDVSAKSKTKRLAIAQCKVILTQTNAFDKLKSGTLDKGDASRIAEIAGLMASKKTSDLIPMCH